jgi:hypothetical protein
MTSFPRKREPSVGAARSLSELDSRLRGNDDFCFIPSNGNGIERVLTPIRSQRFAWENRYKLLINLYKFNKI